MANKFNWENGTLVSKAKVEIGGQVYDVEPEQYSGNTALSAENLNSMQDTLLSNIVNSLDTNDTDKAPSINSVKKRYDVTYSTSEVKTADVWIDGKPIYRKTVYISSLPNNSGTEYNTGITDADTIWADMSSTFCWIDSSKTSQPLPMIHAELPINGTTNSAISLMSITPTTFHIAVGVNRSSWGAYITFKYTKTTD